MAGTGMDYGSMASSAVGLGIGLIGTALGAGEADRARKEALAVANTPGIDFAGLTGEALRGYGANLGAATGLAGQLSAANQAQLNAQEEAALPGVGLARQQALGRIQGLFADDAAWLKGVQRRGAALGLSSGLFGSQAGQISTLRLSDREQMARTQLGTGLLGSLIGGMRLANTPGVQAFLGPSISEQLNQRAGERSQKMNIMLGRASMPTSTGAWGQGLQQLGGALMGVGMTGGFSSVGGGGVGYSGPGSAPTGWGNLSPGMQSYYNNYAATTPFYGAGTNFE